jgi:hypothetical protein
VVVAAVQKQAAMNYFYASIALKANPEMFNVFFELDRPV